MKGLRGMLSVLGVVASASLASTAMAQDRTVYVETNEGPRLEIGGTVGFPTGLSGKGWIDPVNALQAAVAWQPGANALYGSLDYLFHTPSMLTEANVRLPFYAGVGARVLNYDTGGSVVGPRVPLGVTAIFSEFPLSVFAEVAPAMEFGNGGDPGLTADATAGARLYF